MESRLRGAVKAALLIFWLLISLPLLALFRMRGGARYIWFRGYIYRVILVILGFKVKVHGQLCYRPPVLFISNHTSYLDILVLGSFVPGSFVAKQEMEDWPVFNLICKLSNTIHVERKPSKAQEGLDKLASSLRQDDSVILFPEGTTSHGNKLLGFKTSFFKVAEMDIEGLMVQPLSIAYTKLNGLPVGSQWRPFFAWVGDDDLMPHLWQILKQATAVAEIYLHPPIKAAGKDRKALSETCEALIAESLSESIQGRPR